MPQMFPLLWLSLFFATAISLLMMMTLLFFSLKMTPSKFMLKSLTSSKTWKW